MNTNILFFELSYNEWTLSVLQYLSSVVYVRPLHYFEMGRIVYFLFIQGHLPRNCFGKLAYFEKVLMS